MDISSNPISPRGANYILAAISEYNETLGDLGNLDDSSCMGVRIREELRQAVKLNNASQDKKKAQMDEHVEHTKNHHVDSNALNSSKPSSTAMSAGANAGYPLLKPIAFTNIVTDDYLDSYVWQLR